ncbi:MAG: pantoate--beta-alanine ligase, partial [Chloroflexota bacterium]
RMAADLNLPVEIVVCPTVREADGLALSSRNVYLTLEQRVAAPALYRALGWARERWIEGERDAGVLRSLVRDVLDHEPLAQVDYVSVADAETLEELHQVERAALVSVAVRFGSTRLIDNIVLGG